MKNTFNFSFLLALILLVSGCQKEIPSSKTNKTPDYPMNLLTNGQVINNVLFTGQTPYSILLDSVGIYSLFSEFKETPIAQSQSLVTDNNPNINISANNIQLNSQTLYSSSSFTSFFGSTIQYTLSAGSNTLYSDLYIPQIINFVSPPITSQSDMIPFCYFNQFQLEWNSDVNNSNGIIVIVDWKGKMYGQADVDHTIVRNIDIIPDDDGIEVLNNDLFDNIPEDAIATMTIIRGNYQIINFMNNSVKLGGQNMTSLPFILVRDMSHYN